MCQPKIFEGPWSHFWMCKYENDRYDAVECDASQA